jgi:hypothetical protein
MEGIRMSRFTTVRAVLSATAISAALLAATVAQVLAGGFNGPFPR